MLPYVLPADFSCSPHVNSTLSESHDKKYALQCTGKNISAQAYKAFGCQVLKLILALSQHHSLCIQVLGALTPAATAALAYALMGTIERAVTYAALVPVMLGIIIASGYEISFSTIGFALAVGGCLARAFKTVLQVAFPLLAVLSMQMSIMHFCEQHAPLICVLHV